MAKTFRNWTPIEQEFLLPPSLKDFVPQGHVAHFVRNLVADELDLREIVNDYVEDRGAPPFHPAVMTAILLYSYMQGVYSSRKIAKACEERVDYKVVSGMSSPDFRTIAKFRARHLEALSGMFKQVLKLCVEAGLVKLGHVALDGTRIKANASMDNSKSYKRLKGLEGELEAEIAQYFEKARQADKEEDSEFGEDNRGDELPAWVTDKEERRKRFKEAREKLEQEHKEAQEKRDEEEKAGTKPRAAKKKSAVPTDTKRYNFTDPESQIQRGRSGNLQGYNAQIAVDSASHVIVAHDVSSEQNDFNQLAPMLEKIKDNIGENPKELSLDNGYCTELNLRILEDEKIRGYVALGRDPFKRRRKTTRGSAIHRMSVRLRRAGKRTRYRLRSITVEPVFGIIKAARGFREFLMRGKIKVAREFGLVCMAYNLLSLHKARA